jgi:uncharacterized spore protein YtfJ
MKVNELMLRANEAMASGRAFGPAYEKDGVMVIPAAWVVGGGGAGEGEPASGQKGEGGGFGYASWPVGVYVVKDGDVRFIPAIDPLSIARFAMALLKLFRRKK